MDSTVPTDEELMQSIIEGHVEDMDRLVERHNDAIIAYCAKLTGEWETARDLAQETFMKAFRNRSSFDPESSFTPWVYTIARNGCVDYLRKKRTISLDPAVIELRDRQALAHDHLEHKQNLERLENALSRLDPAKRELILLARRSNRGYREIAGSLGCSVSALKVRMHRAMSELRSLYREMENEQM